MLLAGAMPAALAAAKTVPVEVESVLYPGAGYSPIYFPTLPSNCKLISYKSSNTKVLKVELIKDEIAVLPLKVGRSTVTVKYKSKGKTHEVQAVVRVQKYPKPIKTLKVNGNAVKTSKYKDEYKLKKYKKTSAVVKVVPNKGWTVQDMMAFVGDSDTWVESGKSFKIPKGKDATVFIMMSNAKGKMFYYVIDFKR